MRCLVVATNLERLPDPVVPLGALWVATAAARRGHQIAVLDLCWEVDPVSALGAALIRERPQAVGFSIRNLNSNTYDGAGRDRIVAGLRRLADQVRTHAPGAALILGGSGYSLQPTRLLQDLAADWGVVGEGEIVLPELLDALDAGTTGGWPRILAPPFLPELDLASLDLPDRRWTDPRHAESHGVANVQTKRGCAFRCEYCTYPDLEGRHFRCRDPQRVLLDFQDAASQPGVEHVFVVDSVFNQPVHQARAVCQALAAADNRTPWTCYANPAGLEAELVAQMAAAGCIGAEIGADSGVDEVLTALHKPFHRDQITRVRGMLRDHGIHDAHSFILGTRCERREQWMQTLDFAEELDPDVAIFMVWNEDRELREGPREEEQARILEELVRRARNHVGWVVPYLDLRFQPSLMDLVRRAGFRGPSWLSLAKARRRCLSGR